VSDVTVVIPAHNAGAYIGMAISSVLQQTIHDVPILVVDDGSNDDTEYVMRPFGERITYIRTPQLGSATARNIGILNASTDCMAFLDADDWWQPDHLELLLAALNKNPDAGMVYGAKVWVDSDGVPIPNAPIPTAYPTGWIFRDLLYANYISTSSVVIRKSVALSIGGFDQSANFRLAQDYDLYIRVAARYPLIHVPNVRNYYRRHSDNVTHNSAGRIRGRYHALKKAVEAIRNGQVDARNQLDHIDVDALLAMVYSNTIMEYFHVAEYAEIRRIGMAALHDRMLSIPSAIRWLCALPPPSCTHFLRSVFAAPNSAR
jgi:glycosyltransferase involved in cell wall biosynthesis